MEPRGDDRTKMCGREILQYFAYHLARVEASFPCLSPVTTVSAVHDLDACRKTYEGTPVVFPASAWTRNWHHSFPVSSPSSSSSLPAKLQSLLGDCVDVEVFRLHYHVGVNSKDTTTGTDSKEADFVNVSHLNSRPRQQTRFQEMMEEEGSFRNGGGDFTLVTATSSENNWPLHQVHPIPNSSMELMEFTDFVSEALFLLLHPANELMYLTWRSLPSWDDLKYSSVPSEFLFFIEKLIHPTTTPEFLSSEIIKQRNLWMGCLVTSRLHFDALDNVHICLSGGKVFHLYSPLDLPNMYPEPWREGASNNFSNIGSIFLANLKEYPNFFNAKCFRAEIKEGEAIFIPAGWWHEVFTLQYSVSANVWFGPSENSLFRPTMLYLKSEGYLNFMLKRQKFDTI